MQEIQAPYSQCLDTVTAKGGVEGDHGYLGDREGDYLHSPPLGDP